MRLTGFVYDVCRFFSGLSIASLILYFVTSSDSGSLVIDCLTSNGNPSPPVFQRIFWSCTEGAVAMALLFVGGEDSLGALRSVRGLPFSNCNNKVCSGIHFAAKFAAKLHFALRSGHQPRLYLVRGSGLLKSGAQTRPPVTVLPYDVPC